MRVGLSAVAGTSTTGRCRRTGTAAGAGSRSPGARSHSWGNGRCRTRRHCRRRTGSAIWCSCVGASGRYPRPARRNVFDHARRHAGFLTAGAGRCMFDSHRGKGTAGVEFLAPSTWADALAARSEHPGAVPIAGGTDVMVELNFDRHRPDVLIDLTRVPELGEWSRSDDGGIRLGAGVTFARVMTELAEHGSRAGDGVPDRRLAADPGARHGRRQPGLGLPGRRRAPGAARDRRRRRGRVGARGRGRSRSRTSSPA